MHQGRPDDAELAAMRKKIDAMQKLYFVLFFTSLAILLTGFVVHLPKIANLFWVLTLGGAVITRIQRQSLVTKYNAKVVGGGPSPMA